MAGMAAKRRTMPFVAGAEAALTCSCLYFYVFLYLGTATARPSKTNQNPNKTIHKKKQVHCIEKKPNARQDGAVDLCRVFSKATAAGRRFETWGELKMDLRDLFFKGSGSKWLETCRNLRLLLFLGPELISFQRAPMPTKVQTAPGSKQGPSCWDVAKLASVTLLHSNFVIWCFIWCFNIVSYVFPFPVSWFPSFSCQTGGSLLCLLSEPGRRRSTGTCLGNKLFSTEQGNLEEVCQIFKSGCNPSFFPFQLCFTSVLSSVDILYFFRNKKGFRLCTSWDFGPGTGACAQGP